MGLTDPRTGRRPYAVVQLRQENARAGSYNLVGFQNHMRFGDQARVLRMIPGFEHAEFLRYGQVHRNTYINGPALLDADVATARDAEHFFRRTNFGRGGIRGIDRHRIGRGPRAAAMAVGESPRAFPARNRDRFAVRVRFGRRSGELSTGEHHLRPAAEARRTAAGSQTAACRSVPSGAGCARRISCAPMSELAHTQSTRYLASLTRRKRFPAYAAKLRLRSGAVRRIFSPPDSASSRAAADRRASLCANGWAACTTSR